MVVSGVPRLVLRELGIGGGQGLQRGTDFVDARVQRVRLDLAEANHVAPVEDEECAGAHALALPKHTEHARNLPPRLEIRQQGETELRFTRERRMTVDAVSRDTEQPNTGPSELARKFLIEDVLVV
jgi:hypothetical protein